MGMPAPIPMFTAMIDAWDKEHKGCPASPEATKREQERWDAQFRSPEAWIKGNDRGTSSETLWAFFMKRPGGSGSTGRPHDPSDFGRCHRLLQAFPLWRVRLPEFLASWSAEQHPAWKPLIEHWAELEALFVEEVPDGVNGAAPRLWARMKELAP
jgi:hypothetical protein